MASRDQQQQQQGQQQPTMGGASGQGGGGLGHSTPLVRLPATPPPVRPLVASGGGGTRSISPVNNNSNISSSSVSVAVTDHPLSPTFSADSASTPPPQLQQQHQLPPSTASYHHPLAAAAAPQPAAGTRTASTLPRPPPPPPPHPRVPAAATTSTAVAPPAAMATTTTTTAAAAPPPPPPRPRQHQQHPRSAPPSASTNPLTVVSPAHQTLDDLANAFLQGPRSLSSSSSSSSVVLHPDPLPTTGLSDLERLRLLVQRRAWADVIRLAERLLRGPSSHYAGIYNALLQGQNSANSAATPAPPLPALDSQQADLVWILHVACQGWVKMKRYADLGLEIERWGFCHHNDNTAPAWIPWSLHIVAASSLLYTCANTNMAVDALWAIRSDLIDLCSNNSNSASSTTNETLQQPCIALLQVEHALANAFIRRRDWRMALASQERMLDALPAACRFKCHHLHHHHKKDATTESSFAQQQQDVACLQAAYTCEILSRQGRILLQVGALEEGSHIFDRATAVWNEQTSSSSSSYNNNNHTVASPATANVSTAIQQDGIVLHTPAQLTMNDGLYHFSKERYEQAQECFEIAAEQIRSVSSMSASSSPSMTLSVNASSSFGNFDHELLPADLLSGSSDNDHTTNTTSHSSSSSSTIGHALYSETINNMALCGLYTCQLPQALKLMEGLVRDDPTHYLTERVALNLCTLYELSYETAQSARKKRVLQLIAKRFTLHDIMSENFRL